ncbi:MAG: hypothetical protein Q8K59_10610 [Nitrosomonas sp.]|nr:hypothetical protein [Nitrosomonas sp.]
MNEFITEYINELPINAVRGRSWFEILSILAPSVILITGLFSLSFFIKRIYFKKLIYIFCLSLTLLFLPYELFRQAADMSKADANIEITQNKLKALLNSSNLDFLDQVVDKAVATKTLEKLIFDLSDEQKQELILVSWLIAENEMKSNQLLNNDIRLSLDDLKGDIIKSRPPVDKISADILQRIDQDVTQLIEIKMKSFNQEIDNSLESFQEGVNSFIQTQLQEYGKTLDLITQRNTDELRNYTSQARNAFAREVNESNKKSLQKLQETKNSVDNVGAALERINLKAVVTDVRHLSASVNDIREKNDILFTYNECLRSVGLFDLSGKEEKCRTELNKAMDSFKAN